MKLTTERMREISYEISEAYRGKIADHGTALIATAYVLAKAQQSSAIETGSIAAFVRSADLAETVSDILIRSLTSVWETVVSFIGKYQNEELEQIVLYDNTFFDAGTPESFGKLAGSLLSIGEQDMILDVCSGVASFPAYTLQNTKVKSYTGIDINYSANDTAVLRASLLGDNYTFILSNALTYQYSTSYDKIFSNYPFALRGADLDECRRMIQERFNMNGACISRCSSDWLFNAVIISALNESGKAVAIMTNGAAFNKPDMYMRQFFIENGYIEAVINLPGKMFNNTMIPTTMIVFSYNNQTIKLVDATNICSKVDRRINTFSDEDIQNILNCIENGGENTVELSPADMREHDYNLMASHYLEMPVIENGVSLGSIIKSISRGAQVKPEVLESYRSFMPTDLRFISLANLSNGTIDVEDSQQYLKELPKTLEKFVAPHNSIVLSKMASPTFRSAVINTESNDAIVATGNLYIIEVDESKANPYYIQAFFDSEAGEAALNYASGGSVVKTISAEAVKSLMIPLPTLDVQNEIALKYQAALDEYAVLKRKEKKVLEKKRTLLTVRGDQRA